MMMKRWMRYLVTVASFPLAGARRVEVGSNLPGACLIVLDQLTHVAYLKYH
jgi:hypothetical protein